VTTHSPARIIAKHLIDEDLAADPTVSPLGEFPVYVSYMPDTTDIPAEAIAVTDTEGVKDGRYMEGPNVGHPGVQIRIRAQGYEEGWQKAQEIAALLEAAAGVSVTVSGTTYTLHNASQSSPVLSLGMGVGQEGRTNRRFNFAINYLLTVSQVGA
jgi:hypothetical protein